jgi:hypothetical protein
MATPPDVAAAGSMHYRQLQPRGIQKKPEISRISAIRGRFGFSLFRGDVRARDRWFKKTLKSNTDSAAIPGIHIANRLDPVTPLRMCLGACPRIRRGRVPSAAGADARRRDAGDVAVHRRGAPTPQMPLRRRNPKGARGLRGYRCVARRQRCAPTSPPPRALRSPRKPHARDSS